MSRYTSKRSSLATQSKEIPSATPEPIRLTRVQDTVKPLGIGVRTFLRMVSAGAAPQPVKLGGSRVWRSDIMENWISNNCPDLRKKGGAA